MKLLVAKYPGRCRSCSKPIAAGQTIKWFGRGQAEHQYCFQPDGPQPASEVRAPCWICKAPEGKFRQIGAGTPVWCDACYESETAKSKRRFEPDRFDLQVEDSMRDACGL